MNVKIIKNEDRENILLSVKHNGRYFSQQYDALEVNDIKEFIRRAEKFFKKEGGII